MAGHWGEYLKILRTKWFEIPLGNQRVDSRALESMADADLLALWQCGKREQTEGELGFSLRGWYHIMYKPIVSGRKVLDVGAGTGVDGISFAEAGARVTFLDIVEQNLKIVERLCRIKGILDNVDFLYLDSPESLDKLQSDYDFVWCQGSQITIPFDFAQMEDQALMTHLRRDGRWIELAYPKARWEREGRKPFEQWGTITDGGAPWIEWYDLQKLLRRLEPARFNPILSFDFHNGDFNWFDLQRVS